jgi:hypothetical protein
MAMPQSKEFYQGSKAREQNRKSFADEGSYEQAKRLCPYPEDSPEWKEWTKGFLAWTDLEEIEDFVDTTQLSLEEVQEFTEHRPLD